MYARSTRLSVWSADMVVLPCRSRQLSMISVSPLSASTISWGCAKPKKTPIPSKTLALSWVAGEINRPSHLMEDKPQPRSSRRRSNGRQPWIGRRGRTRALFRAVTPNASIRKAESNRCVPTELLGPVHRRARYLGGTYQCARSVWSGKAFQPKLPPYVFGVESRICRGARIWIGLRTYP
jgi:hypothetical protein